MDHSITHACGHLQIHHVLGFTQQQLRKVARLEMAVCDSCKQAARRASSAAAAAQQAAAIAHLTLAGLTGSPRQIAWAETIRTACLSNLLADPVRGMPEASMACAAVTEAKWWIDHRHLPLADLAARATEVANRSTVTVAAAA